YAANICTGLMLAINNLAVRSFPDLESWGGIEEASEKVGSVVLSLGRNGIKPSFAKIEIFVHDLDSKELVIEIFAEHEAMDFTKEPKLELVNIESLMQKYSSLKPIVTEGITHLYGVIENE